MAWFRQSSKPEALRMMVSSPLIWRYDVGVNRFVAFGLYHFHGFCRKQTPRGFGEDSALALLAWMEPRQE
jgi:hypothetical protein